MLEQQQVWLVRGLQEIYQRTPHGQGWVGDRLRTQANGHPLTHDLLTSLGVLDESEGERFEECSEATEQKLRAFASDHIQHQQSSDGDSDGLGFSGDDSSLSLDDFFNSQRRLDSTTLASGPTTQQTSQIIGSRATMLTNTSMSMEGAVNPLALQRGNEHYQQWVESPNFNPSHELHADLTRSTDCANLSSDYLSVFQRPTKLLKCYVLVDPNTRSNFYTPAYSSFQNGEK